MKNIIYTALFICAYIQLSAQVPIQMNYQGLILDEDEKALISQDVDIELALWFGGGNGNEVFREGHTVRTNSKGIFSLVIGSGSPIFRSLANVNFSAGDLWIQVEADLDGDGTLEDLGFSALNTVPYAFHAKTVENADDADADPTNEIQNLSINGNTLSISGGNSINIPTGGGSGDDDPNNEIQNLSVLRNGVVIELDIDKGGNGVTFAIDDDDADPANELQNLVRVGDFIELTNGGGSVKDEVDDADADPSNEIQSLIRVGDFIELTHGGGSVQDLVEDADADPGNEIQTLSLVGDSLLLSGSAGVKLPMATSYWEKVGDSLRYTSGSVSVESQGGNEFARIRQGSLLVGDGSDTLAAVPGGVIMRSSQGGATGFLGAHGLQYVRPVNGNQSTAAVLTHDSLKFEGGANANYARDFLRFSNDTLPFILTAAMNEQIFIQAFDTSSAIRSAFGTNLESPSFASQITPQKVELTRKNTPFGDFASWTLSPDSLIGFNNRNEKAIDLSIHPITQNGRLSLTGNAGQRLAYLGDEFIVPGTGIFALYGNDENKILNLALNHGETTWSGGNGSNNVVITAEEGASARGRIEIHNSSGDLIWESGVNSSEEGYLNILNKSERPDLQLTTNGISLFDGRQDPSWSIGQTTSWNNAPVMWLRGSNESNNAYLGYNLQTNNPNVGEFRLYDDSGAARVNMDGRGTINGESIIVRAPTGESRIISETNGANQNGTIEVKGSNGTTNFMVTSFTPASPNDGRAQVYDNTGQAQAGMYTANQTGYVYADVHQFRSGHPNQLDKEICYAALDGPEVAAYVRGSHSLQNGEVFVRLPDHFLQIAATHEYTVTLTPQEWDTYGLAVIEKTHNGFKVKELKGGTGNFAFDWEVKSKRRGFENYQVIQNAKVKQF